MNKLKLLGFLTVSVVLLYTGALLHEVLLSAVDGVHALDRRHGRTWTIDFRTGMSTSSYDSEWPKSLPMPTGFSLSPSTANFIFSSLLRKAWHWGASATSYLYVDSQSYYLVSSFPGNVKPCSFNAKRFGTRIHGKTGQVWDPILKQWEYKGYIDISRATFLNTVTNGMYTEKLHDAVGESFSSDLGAVIYDTEQRCDIHHYWCEDGEAIITLYSNRVINVSTNITFMRL